MMLDSWSVALLICALLVLFLMGLAARSAVRILLFRHPDGDSPRQAGLENELWMSSILVEYGFAVQIVSLVVFVLHIEA